MIIGCRETGLQKLGCNLFGAFPVAYIYNCTARDSFEYMDKLLLLVFSMSYHIRQVGAGIRLPEQSSVSEIQAFLYVLCNFLCS